MKTMDIEDLLEYLNYSDLRAVRKWCEENSVFIIDQGLSEFVIETNFFEAYHLPFINYLKSKFGADWEPVYRLHIDGNVPALNMLQEIPSVTNKLYKPKNKIVQDYLEKYKSHGKNKAA